MERAAGETIEPVDEGFLSALGVHRIPVPVPFLEAGGPVNVYAIRNSDSTWTLFDCGVGTEEGVEALRAGLQAHGVQRISRLIISHGHVDHYGNAQLLAEETGAKVLVHRADLEKVCGDGRWFRQLEVHWATYLSYGVPEDTLREMLASTKRAPTVARQLDRDRVTFLEPGTRLTFEHFEATALHLPGHTPGLMCLHAEAQRVLFADDHVLALISPNPLLDFSQGVGDTKFKSLVRYLENAHLVRALELDAVLPGHGKPFRGHRPLLDGLFEFYVRRQDKLVARLQQAPATAYELVSTLFPRRDVPRLYLMLSEAIGNLEVLETAGRIRRTLEGGVVRFSPA